MTFLLHISEVAKTVSDVLLRWQLNEARGKLGLALAALHQSPTVGHMVAANGEWANATRLLDRVRDNDGGSHGGALREGAELQRKAA